MRVDDFVPIEEHFEQAGSVFISDGGSWLTEPAAVALAGSDGVTIAFGEPRLIGRALVVALHWAAASGPCSTLDADLRLEPMPAARSHLRLSGLYQMSSAEADGNDATTGHHLTESCVRCFLVGVAVTLERARPEYPPPPSGERAAGQGRHSSQRPAAIRQRTALPSTEH